MTDRGLPQSDAATACPFVAFEDDRDERSDRPDHRHRCYADVHPAPRAIAHQEAYCLSAAFAVCPTFQDWAQREAARARGGGATGTGAGQAARDVVAERGARAQADDESEDGAARAAADDRERDRVMTSDTGVVPAAEWQGSRPSRDDDLPPALPPRRNPPRDWAAPPPWAGGPGGPAGGAAAGAAGAAAAAGSAGGVGPGRRGVPDHGNLDAAGGPHRPDPPGDAPPPFLADRESRGLAGSAADRLAGGDPRTPSGQDRLEASPRRPDPFIPSRSSERAQAADEELAGLVRRRDQDPDRAGPRDDDTGRQAGPGAVIGGAVGPGAGRRPPPPPRDEDDAPSWEHPRRFEAYPTIKTRSSMGGLPRLAVMAAALGIAALALFLLPAALNWFGDSPGANPGPGASGEPSPSAAIAPSASPQPTTPAAPTPQVYVIKSGDTLSKIAQQFNVSLDDLLEANRENIPDPDTISIGDQVIIPVPEPDELPDASAAAP